MNNAKVVVLTGSELSELIRKSVQDALSNLQQNTTKSEKLSRQATAVALGVSLSSLDRIARTQPDLLPKHRENGRPFFYRADVERYLEYTGKGKIT